MDDSLGRFAEKRFFHARAESGKEGVADACVSAGNTGALDGNRPLCIEDAATCGSAGHYYCTSSIEGRTWVLTWGQRRLFKPASISVCGYGERNGCRRR